MTAIHSNPEIHALYRYPVKGLSPEKLSNISLRAGQAVTGDRAYAIEVGSERFDPEAPAFFAKSNFLMLMRDEALAALKTRFEPATAMLFVSDGGAEAHKFALGTPQGRALAEAYFAKYLPKNIRERGITKPKIVSPTKNDGFTFSDLNQKVISIVNLASVRALEEVIGTAIDPLRFRANIYLEGLAPWQEMEYLGASLNIGSAVLTGVKMTKRCPAINVNPQTGERDQSLTQILPEHFGHSDCGIYMKVTQDGDIAVGDRVSINAPIA